MSRSLIDVSDFTRIAKSMRALESQIPFALSQSLNASVEIARQAIVDTTWPEHIRVRNPNFLKAALTTKGTWATKRNLRVELYDRLGRASLLQHDRGGVKRPLGSAIAVPSDMIKARRTGKGVPKSLQPREVPDSFKKGTAIYQRAGTYTKASKGARAQDNRKLKLLYVLERSVSIKADVPFHRDFDRVMRSAMPIQFRRAVQKAMTTAIRR